jgi:glyoxylase-like metal-dependent hydrolase (beta-lactamase superfamily II)
MFFQQYVLGCLSQLSYLVGDGSTGRAVVVDPHRDVSVYLQDATEHGLRIERVIETHVHADFLSGHLELAAHGAAICYGAGAQTDFDIESLADGQRIDLGEVQLEIRATPVHTPESISVVIYEHRDSAEPSGVLTGDALFIGDVGGPICSDLPGCPRISWPGSCTGRFTRRSSRCRTGRGYFRRTGLALRAARTCRARTRRRSASSG